VRISSTDTFGFGTLWVLDASHVPFGCGYVAGWHNDSASDANVSSRVLGAYWSEAPVVAPVAPVARLTLPARDSGNIISHPIRLTLTSTLGEGGEIYIFEGVNVEPSTEMTLRTDPGCNMTDGLPQTGTPLSLTCDASSGGCGVVEENPNSYGGPFANAEGGVWVTEFDTSGIRIWFVPVRDNTSGLFFPSLT
jgi:hypothetical protein